jgi:hypothetical protein
VSEVRITNTGSGATYLLSDSQRTQFERELSRTAPWRTPRTLVSFILGRDRFVPPLIAEDAEIEVVTDSGRPAATACSAGSCYKTPKPAATASSTWAPSSSNGPRTPPHNPRRRRRRRLSAGVG